MSRILLAWELGTGFGHLGPFLGLAPKLLERGHELHIAAREIAGACRAVAGLPITVHQAPLCLNTYSGLQDPPLNFAEILMRYGYLDPPMLRAMVIAWRSLLRVTGAKLVIADHAPTALIAARLSGIATAVVGTPFSVPPDVHPSPNMRPWVDVPAARLADSDARVLAVINAALPAGAAPVTEISRIFSGAGRLFAGVPELDPYLPRDPGDYLGMHTLSTGSAAPSWPTGNGPRVFCYFHADYRHIERALQAVAECGARVLVYVNGLPAPLAQRFTGAGLQFASTLLDMRRLVEECDLCVCHGNIGTALSMLGGGRPLLVLPKHLEQFLLGRALEQIGAGRVVLADDEAPDIAGSLRAMLADAAFAGKARAFAERYRGESVGTMTERAVARIEELASQGAGHSP
ncbi:MAG: glycosyltransferase [Burkholderiales bacterium]